MRNIVLIIVFVAYTLIGVHSVSNFLQGGNENAAIAITTASGLFFGTLVTALVSYMLSIEDS